MRVVFTEHEELAVFPDIIRRSCVRVQDGEPLHSGFCPRQRLLCPSNSGFQFFDVLLRPLRKPNKALLVNLNDVGEEAGFDTKFTVLPFPRLIKAVENGEYDAAIAGITGITAANKVYDGNTTATLGGTAAFTGILGGDTLTVATSTEFSRCRPKGWAPLNSAL